MLHPVIDQIGVDTQQEVVKEEPVTKEEVSEPVKEEKPESEPANKKEDEVVKRT